MTKTMDNDNRHAFLGFGIYGVSAGAAASHYRALKVPFNVLGLKRFLVEAERDGDALKRRMVSLPNLQELEDITEQQKCPAYKRHVKCHRRAPFQVRSRYSNLPSRVRSARSVGNYNAVSIDIRCDKCNHNHFHFAAQVDGRAYSPASSRSIRSIRSSSTIPSHQVSKTPRESMSSSSAGASSVRRLISVVRSTPSKTGPIYSRRLLFRNFAALCLSHSMITAAFVPLFILQGSLSVWWLQPDLTTIDQGFHVEVGSLLLTSLFVTGSLSALGSLFLVNRFGTTLPLIFSYCGTCIFIGLHLYPNAYTLIPAYLFMGLWLGPLDGARITCLMELSTKLSFVMTEQEMGEAQSSQCLRPTEVAIHKLSRGLQLAQDFGFIMGNVTTSLLIWYTTKHETAEAFLDNMFSVDDNGERICGSAVCPLPLNYEMLKLSDGQNNASLPYQPLGISCKTNTILISIFLGFCVMSVTVTAAFMDHIKVSIQKATSFRTACCSTFRLIQETFKDHRIQMIAPLCVFIGLVQGFMYTVFSKSYVACTLGVKSISIVFLGFGVLQSIAAFTLSMVLQHIRRRMIMAAGILFQSGLLLMLSLWKPSKDDPALFYVVPAVWGVCNAIWDTLSFTLIVAVYPDNWPALFTQCYFFRYLGLAFSFGIHSFFCDWLKLYGLVAAMILAIVPYVCLEMRLGARRQPKNPVQQSQANLNPYRSFSQALSFQGD